MIEFTIGNIAAVSFGLFGLACLGNAVSNNVVEDVPYGIFYTILAWAITQVGALL